MKEQVECKHEWYQGKCVHCESTPNQAAYISQLEKQVEELSQQVCDVCCPDDYGWQHNAVEGRAPCICQTESGVPEFIRNETIEEFENTFLKRDCCQECTCDLIVMEISRKLKEGE